MDLWRALFLGGLQGVTEFWPVSSSGHLTIVPWLLGWPLPALSFDAVLHLGTLLAVLLVFWRDILQLLAAWWRSILARKVDGQARIAWCILIATVPGALAGFFLDDLFETVFASPIWVAIFLLLTGVILVIGERLSRTGRPLEALGWKGAVAIGLAQAVAIAPGISRSGATIAAGLGLGLQRREAARFSFLLSIPIILGAGGSQLLHLLKGGAEELTWSALGAGFLAALVSGYLCIRFLLSFLQRGRLYVFALYCWGVGLITLAVWALRGA
jgi:undecaprenyl-diphosphatase